MLFSPREGPDRSHAKAKERAISGEGSSSERSKGNFENPTVQHLKLSNGKTKELPSEIFLRPKKTVINSGENRCGKELFNESSILAQDERWRHA